MTINGVVAMMGNTMPLGTVASAIYIVPMPKFGPVRALATTHL